MLYQGDSLTFWLVIGALSLATIVLVLWPFVRGRQSEIDGTRATLLAALEKAEADHADDAMRNEIARRLIAHDREHTKAQKRGGRKLGWALALLAVLFIPLGAFSVYAFHGAYGLIAIQAEDAELKQSIAKVEARLAISPEDWRGWSVIAPVYRSRGQFDKASDAFANAIKFKTDITAEERSQWQSDRVELMFMKGEGQLPRETGPILADALKANPNNPKALYFDAFYAEQFDAAKTAIEKWSVVLNNAKQANEIGLFSEAERRIMRLEMLDDQTSVAPNQNVAVVAMVSQLEKRLTEKGGSAEEWMRLINSFGVLKNRSRFAKAVDNARTALADDAQGLKTLERVEREILKRDFGE